MSHIPELINWMFDKKPDNLKKITAHFGEFQGELFSLFEFFALAENLRHIEGIQEKVTETTNGDKLKALSSELFFANQFSKSGFAVSLISDSSKEWCLKKQTIPSPDFKLFKDGLELFVEVARISNDETTSEIGSHINSLLRNSNSNFCVRIHFSIDFATPVVCSKERTSRDELIEKFVIQFKNILPTVDSASLPQSREILGCKIDFCKPLHGKIGYYAGCITAPVEIPDKLFKKQLEDVVRKKAEKRQKWTNSQKEKPYLVALDIQQFFCFSDILPRLLFGGQCVYDDDCPPPSYAEPPIVSQAKTLGWQEFLEDVGFNPQSSSRINDIHLGLLIKEACICKNLSGIIVRIQDRLLLIPNPFAEEAINPIKLKQLIQWSKPKDLYDLPV